MENNNKHSITFCELLLLIFIVLKLTKVINWSWLWVLSPLWIHALILLIGIGLKAWLEAKDSDNYKRKSEAERYKDKWQTGTPPKNVWLSFHSGKVWHNGSYHEGKFYIVGDSTKKPYDADKWYIKE